MTVLERWINLSDSPEAEHTHSKSATALNWRLLQYLNIYRLTIAALATITALLADDLAPFGQKNPQLFLHTAFIYLIVTVLGARISRQRQPDFDTQVSVATFADVTFITLLMHASGGLSSGLGLFLIIAIAGSSLLLGKRMTIFFASLATVAALLEHSWQYLTGSTLTTKLPEGFTQVGILGIGLFATATLGYSLARRLRTSEALAERRGVDLAHRAQINELVIQRMQSGVIFCDPQGKIGLINKQAQDFLGLSEVNNSDRLQLPQISPELNETLGRWLAQPHGPSHSPLQKPVRSKGGYTLLPRFELLGTDPGAGILIFLDDTGVLKQQAQQLKMAALARLTASIAHEIRNPLGAISNAAQLLAESTPAQSQDKRLVEIIEDHCRRMNVIIENITQLSRRDRVSLETLPLYTWAHEFQAQFGEINAVPLQVMAVSGPAELSACVDPDQLYQILTNLCQNALRYCPPFSGKPLIELRLGHTKEGSPFLDVLDQGSGVPPEIAENIFDPFFTTASNGTGLGLYISRELCEGNGGSLEYLSGQAPGACFRITFAKASDCDKGALS